MEATVTDRHATVTRELASVTVEEPCLTRTCERTVTYRHDIPDIFTHAHARTRGATNENNDDGVIIVYSFLLGCRSSHFSSQAASIVLEYYCFAVRRDMHITSTRTRIRPLFAAADGLVLFSLACFGFDSLE